ncbi:MAG: hypothetical protein ACI37Z_09330 [Candidatus Gastranaerophilaceae bacterium]
MKTLGFGLKSLLKDPKWALKHNIDPNNQTAGSVVGNPKPTKEEESIFNRAKAGDMDNSNNIFSQASRINPFKQERNQNLEEKIGGLDNNKNVDVFSLMNKFDENHKVLAGSNAIQASPEMEQMNNMSSEEELKKKLGKKLNIMM